MPLVLIAVGIALVIAAIRGTLQTGPKGTGLLDLLYSDFVGPGNFFTWIVSIVLVGSVGYYRPLRPVADAFMVLIIIVFLLAANKGGKDFFSSLENQLVNRTTNPATPGYSSGNYSGSIPINDPSLSPIQISIPSIPVPFGGPA